MKRLVTLVLFALLLCATVVAAQDGGTIKTGDAVAISVLDQPELSNTYIASGVDGGIVVPLAGRLTVAGQTPAQVAAELQRRLQQYFRNPDVRVEIVHVRRIFVFGEVQATGEYPLEQNTTLLEVLARAGYKGTPEVIVLRSKNGLGPTPINDPGAQVTRVNLAQLEKETAAGRLSRNVLLNEGDTIYVSKDTPDRIYVSGEVDQPGAYSIVDGTTVLQALTLAGGATARASMRGMRIVRVEGEDQKSIDASLDAPLQPGDTLYIPRGYSLPWPTFGRPDLKDREAHAIKLGPLSLVPTAAVTRIGIDTNVFNAQTQPTSDFVVSAGPALDVVYDLKPVRVSATGVLDFVYFERSVSQRYVDRSASASIEVTPNRRMGFRVGGGTIITNDRPDPEVDARVPRIDQSVEGSVTVRPFQRVSFEVGAKNFDRWFTAPFIYFGTDLSLTLTERVQSATVTTRTVLTPFTTLVGSAAVSTHRFDLDHTRDANANQVLGGAEWQSGGLLSGDARVGYVQYLSLSPGRPDIKGLIGDIDVFYMPFDRTRFGFKVSRSTGDTYHDQFSFAIIDRLGGSIQQGFARRFDVLLESYLERYGYEGTSSANNEKPAMSYETSFRHAGDLGIRFGPVRLGLSVSYVQRYTDFISGRNFNAFRMLANLTYGVVQVRADQ